jgi:uncharacterized protein (TIGR03083 family)
MTDTPEAGTLWRYVETWHRACSDFVALARGIGEDDADRATDLAGWSVRDNVAHTAHLEAVLAGAPEETIEVPDAPHVRGLMNVYTEQGVLARRGRTVAELADELEDAVARRYAALQEAPPTDPAGRPPVAFAGMPWNNETLLGNRPLDVWMHEQDIRRALHLPGGYDSPAALHTVDRLAAGLPMVLGKRVAAEPGSTVRLAVPQLQRQWTVTVGEDGRASFDDTADPDVRIALEPQDFVVLAGGRRTVEATDPQLEGDADLGRRFLGAMAITP